jgi:hypothetical protein
MGWRRVLLGLAGFGATIVIGTTSIAGSDLCKSPRLGIVPSWCGMKSTTSQVPEGRVRASRAGTSSGKKSPTVSRPRAFRPPKTLKLGKTAPRR